jgi:diacylglycerol kinase family enzyme
MTIDPSMGIQQRLRARKKSILGTHVPHPLVETVRAKSLAFSSLSRSESLRVDGRSISTWEAVEIEIVPDYWRLLV